MRTLLQRRRFTYPVFGTFGLVAALWVFACHAPLAAPESRLTEPGNVVLDANGVVLARDGAEGFRIPVALDDVAPVMREATLAAEDQRFESHPGVDPIAVGRAVAKWDEGRSGASTITQQLARRLYLDGGSGPWFVRKPREALIALQLEQHRTKDEILELYLNEVYYGRGAYGVEAAARVYFGTSAANLDLARAAFLAGLPQLPSAYDSDDNESARTRQQYVLDRMADDGRVPRDSAEAAKSAPLAILPDIEPAVGAQFVEMALAELRELAPGLDEPRGLVIETTLDAGLQLEAERLARLQLERLRDRNVTNAAVVVLEPETGAVLALVGSTEGAINLALTPRQPGSALKPFLYGAAFGLGMTAASPLLDVPTTFVDGVERYEPQNYDKKFHGVVTLRQALGSSLNVPAVATLEQLGIDRFLEVANSFGLTTLTDAETYGLSLTLGGGDVRLLDLTGAYAALANGGELARPFAVTRVRDSNGKVLYERPQLPRTPVLAREHAYLLSNILADPDARLLGFGERTPFDLPFAAAAKTGTTTGFRDNWALGYTANFAVGVWVGNADASPMVNVSGIDGAGPIWRDVMLAAAMTREPGWPARPPNLVEATVCAPTGLRPGPDCPSPDLELFVAGTEPINFEAYYTRSASGEVLVSPPAAARAWARDAGLLLVTERIDQTAVRIVSPADGATLFLAPELKAQETVLRATAGPTATGIDFDVNAKRVASLRGNDTQFVYPLTAGRHTVTATATYPDGSTAVSTSTFEVKAR